MNQNNQADSKTKKNSSNLLYHFFRYGIGGLIRAGSSLGFTALFTRIFVPEDFGYYNLVKSIVLFSTLISSEWIKQSISRYIPSIKNIKEEKIAKNTIAIYILFITIFFSFLNLIVFIFKNHFNFQFYEMIYAAIFLTWSLIVYQICLQVLSAEINSSYHTLLKSIKSLGRLGFPLIMIFVFSNRIEYLLWGEFIGTILIIPFIWKITNMKLSLSYIYKHFKIIKTNLIKYIKYGFPMIGWFLAYILLAIGDRYIIQIFRGASEVGIYSANYSLIAGGTELVAAPFLLIAHPYLVKVWDQKSKVKVQNIISETTNWFIYLSSVIIIALMFLSQPITEILLGKEYRGGYWVIPIAGAGLLIWHLSMYGHKPLEFEEKTKIMMFGGLGAAFLNIILNIIFVPNFGYIAAAYTTLFSYLSYAIFIYLSVKPYIKWIIPYRKIFRKCIWVVIGGVISTGIISILNGFNFWFQYLLGTMVYFIFSIIIPLKIEKIELDQIFKKIKGAI